MSTPTTRPHWFGRGLAILLALCALALLGWVLIQLDQRPRTDDAYVYADTTQVAPEVSGRIVEIAVHDNQAVHKGDLLLRIDPRPFQINLDKAQAALHALDQEIMLTRRTVRAQQFGAAAAEAAVGKAQAAAEQASDTLRRMEPLGGSDYLSAEQLDQARSTRRAAASQLEAARLEAQRAAAGVSGVEALEARRDVLRAEIGLAKLHLEFTEVRAPHDGIVLNLKTLAGQFAAAGHPIFTLASTEHWYVVANFRETELKHLHPGQAVQTYVLADPSRRFDAVVESTGFGVYPDDAGGEAAGLSKVPRSINWVRVVQRFPVRILVKHPDPALFRIGASAVALVEDAPSPSH